MHILNSVTLKVLINKLNLTLLSSSFLSYQSIAKSVWISTFNQGKDKSTPSGEFGTNFGYFFVDSILAFCECLKLWELHINNFRFLDGLESRSNIQEILKINP